MNSPLWVHVIGGVMKRIIPLLALVATFSGLAVPSASAAGPTVTQITINEQFTGRVPRRRVRLPGSRYHPGPGPRHETDHPTTGNGCDLRLSRSSVGICRRADGQAHHHRRAVHPASSLPKRAAIPAPSPSSSRARPPSSSPPTMGEHPCWSIRFTFSLPILRTAARSRFGQVGGYVARLTPDGLVLLFGGQSLQFTGASKVNVDTGDTLLSRHHSLDAQVAEVSRSLHLMT